MREILAGSKSQVL